MVDILQRLIDLLIQAWSLLVPWEVLPDDACGFVRRLGVYRRPLKHGWNWKCPLVESTMMVCSALDSTVLREQSLTTFDGVQVTLRAVITYRVVNARVYILDVDNAETVINDAGCLAVSELVPELTSAEVLTGTEFTSKLARRVRARAKKWGVEVEAVGLADRTAAPTYRIMGIK